MEHALESHVNGVGGIVRVAKAHPIKAHVEAMQDGKGVLRKRHRRLGTDHFQQFPGGFPRATEVLIG